MYLQPYIYIYSYTCACACVYIYIHVYKCIHIYIYIHVHTHRHFACFICQGPRCLDEIFGSTLVVLFASPSSISGMILRTSLPETRHRIGCVRECIPPKGDFGWEILGKSLLANEFKGAQFQTNPICDPLSS